MAEQTPVRSDFDMKATLLSWSGINEDQACKLIEFRAAVIAENQVQNLTRILDEEPFVHENLRDAYELSKLLPKTVSVLDLGSGNGVPGLPLAILRGDLRVVLSDSELMKADFLRRCVESLGVSNASVAPGRAELYLKTGKADFIVARAVGPVSRIYSWIADCSTWNKLCLLKGPGWEEEWNSDDSRKVRQKLSIETVRDYSTGGAEAKTRKIVILKRN